MGYSPAFFRLALAIRAIGRMNCARKIFRRPAWFAASPTSMPVAALCSTWNETEHVIVVEACLRKRHAGMTAPAPLTLPRT